MTIDVFESILHELGVYLNLELKPDNHQTCAIKYPGNIQVQIELDKRGENLIVGTILGTVSVGTYRQQLFKEALIANGLPLPRYGTFAYSKQANHMVLFEIFNIKEVKSENLHLFLSSMVQKARLWKEAINRGEVIVTGTPELSAPISGKGMFGLRP